MVRLLEIGLTPDPDVTVAIVAREVSVVRAVVTAALVIREVAADKAALVIREVAAGWVVRVGRVVSVAKAAVADKEV